MNKRRVKMVLLGLVVLFLLIQLIQPKRTNPTVIPSRSLVAHVLVPPQVSATLMRACGDCHSSATVWPWYSHVAPVSWMVADDVNVGRSHINLQDWEAQVNPKEATEHLGLICKEVQEKEMPPISYRLMHKEAKLSPEDVSAICAWSKSVGGSDEADDKKGD